MLPGPLVACQVLESLAEKPQRYYPIRFFLQGLHLVSWHRRLSSDMMAQLAHHLLKPLRSYSVTCVWSHCHSISVEAGRRAPRIRRRRPQDMQTLSRQAAGHRGFVEGGRRARRIRRESPKSHRPPRARRALGVEEDGVVFSFTG